MAPPKPPKKPERPKRNTTGQPIIQARVDTRTVPGAGGGGGGFTGGAHGGGQPRPPTPGGGGFGGGGGTDTFAPSQGKSAPHSPPVTPTVGAPPQGGRGFGWWTPERQQYAVEYMKENAGLSEHGARGLVARWAGVESTGRGPASSNAIGGGHWGIAQWSRSRGQALGIWGDTDFDRQLAAAAYELNSGMEARAARALRSASNPYQGAVGAAMFERAEGWNVKTGTDYWVGKTVNTMRGMYSPGVHKGEPPSPNQPQPVYPEGSPLNEIKGSESSDTLQGRGEITPLPAALPAGPYQTILPTNVQRWSQRTMYFPMDQHGHRNVMRRVTVYEVDDTQPQQYVWAKGLYKEEIKFGYRAQGFGLSTVPPKDSEGYAFSLAGRPDQMFFLESEHPDYRPKDKKPGESVLYDANGNAISLVKDSNGGQTEIIIDGSGKVSIKSTEGLTLEDSSGITLTGPVQINGDVNTTGDITSTGNHTAAAHL